MKQRHGSICRLPASGGTETYTEAFEWASEVVDFARTHLTAPITAGLWAYREESLSGLACDLYDDNGNTYIVTFTVGGRNALSCGPSHADVVCYDVVEALHLAAILVRGTAAQIRLGRWGNETNQHVLAEPLMPGAFSGTMAIAGGTAQRKALFGKPHITIATTEA